MGDTFTKEGVVGLVPPPRFGHGGPRVVPTGPVERVQGLGMRACAGVRPTAEVRPAGLGVCLVGYRLMAKFLDLKEIF